MPIQKLSGQNNGWTKKKLFRIFRRNSVISWILHWLDWNWQLWPRDIYYVGCIPCCRIKNKKNWPDNSCLSLLPNLKLSPFFALLSHVDTRISCSIQPGWGLHCVVVCSVHWCEIDFEVSSLRYLIWRHLVTSLHGSMAAWHLVGQQGMR